MKSEGTIKPASKLQLRQREMYVRLGTYNGLRKYALYVLGTEVTPELRNKLEQLAVELLMACKLELEDYDKFKSNYKERLSETTTTSGN